MQQNHKIYFPQSEAESWIEVQLLQFDTGRAALREAEPEQPIAPALINTAAETYATITGPAGSKDIRSGPGMSDDAPHIAYPGDRVKVIDSARNSQGDVWYEIYFPQSGADGWISGALLNVD